MGADMAICYQCLRRLTDGSFAVQSADFFRSNTCKPDSQASDQQFVELFLEEEPTNRCSWFPTLIEAISTHERNFA